MISATLLRPLGVLDSSQFGSREYFLLFFVNLEVLIQLGLLIVTILNIALDFIVDFLDRVNYLRWHGCLFLTLLRVLALFMTVLVIILLLRLWFLVVLLVVGQLLMQRPGLVKMVTSLDLAKLEYLTFGDAVLLPPKLQLLLYLQYLLGLVLFLIQEALSVNGIHTDASDVGCPRLGHWYIFWAVIVQNIYNLD